MPSDDTKISVSLVEPNRAHAAHLPPGSVEVELARANRKIEELHVTLETAQRVAGLGIWQLDVRRNHLSWSAETHRIFGVLLKYLGYDYVDFTLDLFLESSIGPIIK